MKNSFVLSLTIFYSLGRKVQHKSSKPTRQVGTLLREDRGQPEGLVILVILTYRLATGGHVVRALPGGDTLTAPEVPYGRLDPLPGVIPHRLVLLL